MLNRLFKKNDGADTPDDPAVAQAAPTADEAAAWAAQLQAALGDDEALLRVALEATVLQTRLDAVDALAGEDALKHAERELRSHDSRVHKAAKRRLVAAVAQREARAGAQAVIAAAVTVSAEVPLPANRLVAIDRDWQALDASLLTPEQHGEFNALRERINAVLGEEAAHELQQRQEAQEQQRVAAVAHEAQVAEEARLAAEAAALVQPEPAPVAAPNLTLTTEQRAQVEALLVEAETALAEGRLSDVQNHLHGLDAALDALHGVKLSDKLRARHQALHAEQARLKGWQQWGGARALDNLVDEAEALARLTALSTDPGKSNAPKLRLKAHAESIQSLRARWKEIDRTGAPSNQALWHRFDAALHAAYQPVAAQQAALKAARQENLQAREALLATLEATFQEEPADPVAYRKEQARALGSFQLAWRQLGPLEHTVPPGARKALQQRLTSSVERIEAPLNEARGVAQAEREHLVVRAEALVQEITRNPAARDTMPRVRELQAEWQQHARKLPLARPVENALWGRFKAATDAVFKQREAAFSARDAELATNLAAREALIESLTSIDLNAAPVADLQRALAEADRAWRQPVEIPRGAVNAIDKRFNQARAAVAQAVADSANKRWHAQCDGLLGKLALCEAREAASGDADELAARWAAHEALPAAWDKPLAQRWAQAPAPGPLAPAAVDDLLLQLEAALELPASPDMQAARRDLKLRALKDALEGRSPKTQDPVAQRAQWFATLLRQGGLNAAQRERLHALIAVLRQSAAGSLGGAAR